MASAPVVTFVGSAGQEPELKFVQSGKAVASFSLAVSQSEKKGEEWVDGPTMWVRVTAWGTLGENVAESITKGTRVIVQGRYKMRVWTDKEGNERQSYEIDADAIGPDLRWATTSVSKTSSSSGAWTREKGAPASDPWATHTSQFDNSVPF